MIANQTFDSYPEFGNNSTKSQPDNAKYSAGFMPGDVYPAEWVNWGWSKNSKGITDLNTGLGPVEKEINNVIAAAGDSPDPTDNAQLISAIRYLIQNSGSTFNIPIQVSSTQTSENISYDRVFSVTKAGVILTLGSGVYAGVSAKIIASKACTIVASGVSYTMTEGSRIEFTWEGNTWNPVISNNVNYIGTCSDQGSAVSGALTVTCPGFVLIPGIKINVTFTESYDYNGQPTLNVSDTGAYPITVQGVAAGIGAFTAGRNYEFIFNGTNFDCLTNCYSCEYLDNVITYTQVKVNGNRVKRIRYVKSMVITTGSWNTLSLSGFTVDQILILSPYRFVRDKIAYVPGLIANFTISSTGDSISILGNDTAVSVNGFIIDFI